MGGVEFTIEDARAALTSAGLRRVFLALDYPEAVRQAKADEHTARFAAHPDWLLLGARLGGEWVGAIGLRRTGGSAAEIITVSVLAQHRRRGVGSRLVSGAVTAWQLRVLSAETDRHGVGFYRRRGFIVRSLGEKYPGTERFECILCPRAAAS